MPDGLWRTLCRDNESRIVTQASHVSFLDQPDFSNVPSTPFDYCKEAGTGISKEEAQKLAYPCVLTHSQQELLSWHNLLYHLPFTHLFQLARWQVLPHSILRCGDKPPLCVVCQFGQAHRRPW